MQCIHCIIYWSAFNCNGACIVLYNNGRVDDHDGDHNDGHDDDPTQCSVAKNVQMYNVQLSVGGTELSIRHQPSKRPRAVCVGGA